MTRTQFFYKNHRGVTELRIIEPISLDYVASPHDIYGYGPGWFLHGKDFTERDGVARTGEGRSFALTNIQMEGFKYGTKGGAAAFRMILQPGFAPMATGFSPSEKAQILAGIGAMQTGEEIIRVTVAKAGVDLGGNPLPVDEPTGGEAQLNVLTGRLFNASKGPLYPGGNDCLSGESFGHVRFPHRMLIHTSEVVEDRGLTRQGNHLFKTKSGSLYLVMSWLPGHEPKKSEVDAVQPIPSDTYWSPNLRYSDWVGGFIDHMGRNKGERFREMWLTRKDEFPVRG